MPRIQILELPTTADGETPFALILDQFDVDEAGPTPGYVFHEFAKECGARAAGVFEVSMDLPTPTPAAHIGTATVKVEPDVSGFEDAVRDVIERTERGIVDGRLARRNLGL